MDFWEIITELLKKTGFLLNTISLVIGFILGLCSWLITDMIKRQIEKKERIDTSKKFLHAISEEIKEGMNRCKWLISQRKEGTGSFSRIYTGLFDSVKLKITENIYESQIIILLHKIYYRFDLINLNMNRNRFLVGAAFAEDYFDEIDDNYTMLQHRIQIL